MSNLDLKAKNWDTKDKIDRSNTIAKVIKDNINLNKNMDVLDFGCGTGLLTYPLIQEVNSIKAIDLSSNMLEVLIEKNKENHNITTEVTGIFEITSQFDLITSSMVMHHIKDTPKLSKKLFTLLNDGGYIAMADLMKEDGSFHNSLEGIHSKGYTREFLEKTFKEAGFSEIKIIENIFSIDKGGKSFPLFLLIAKRWKKTLKFL